MERSPGRTGVTLMELLVVIVVIMVLVGLMMGGLSLVRHRAAKTATVSLLRQVADAVFAYGQDGGFARAGSVTDFAARPVKYLILVPNKQGISYLELPIARAGDGAGTAVEAWQEDGTILDFWGSPIRFEGFSEGGTARRHLAVGTLRSEAGTASTTDDIRCLYDSSAGGTWALAP